MDRSTSCLAAVVTALLSVGAPVQAQFMTDLGYEPVAGRKASDAWVKSPALGWISIVDDLAALRSGAEMALGNGTPFSGQYRQESGAMRAIELGDTGLEAGRFGGLKGTLPVMGLAWDLGIVYRAPPEGAGAALAGTGDDALGVHSALRYDLGGMAVTASLNYAPQYLASDKSTYYPMLAAEVPIGNTFTLSAGIARPWTHNEASFSAPDYTQWSLSGTVNMLGFDVMLSYSNSDGAEAADTPGTEAQFKLKRAF